MRARVFIDFWNFQLGWNDATNKAKCSWSTLPTVLVKEAGKLLAATGDTSGLVLDETIVTHRWKTPRKQIFGHG
jgi:hypothetical protein